MITRELARFVHSIDVLPEGVEDAARYLLLDYLGVALGGTSTEPAKAVKRMLGLDRSPMDAALYRGTAAHSLELDDTHNAGSIHLGAVMFSTALALGGRILPAVVAGYETAARAAMALGPKHHYARGFHPTGTCGTFGAAVTAAKLMNLREDQILSAMGIAGSMAAGSLEFLAEGAWTKPLHAGLAARNGILAAKLAAHGFQGPSTILEGRHGFLQAYSNDPKPDLVTAKLGSSWAILETSVKPHACCRYMQAPIDGILELRKNIGDRNVSRIEVSLLEAGWDLIAEPRGRKYHPQSVIDAQFSMPFGAAVALVRGRAGLDEFSESALADPEIRAAMKKVVLMKDTRLEKNFPREWPARVALDSEEIYIRHPKGDPRNPLTWDELRAKFRSLAGRAVSEPRLNGIEEWVASSLVFPGNAIEF